MKRKIAVICAALTCAGIMYLAVPIQSLAADESVLFGSGSYRWDVGSTSEIGIYAASDEVIEHAEFTVSYDPEMLELNSEGFEASADGKIYVSEEGNNTNLLKTTLAFTPLRGGASEITVEKIIITTEEEDVSVKDISTAPVWIEPDESCALTDILVNGMSVFSEEANPSPLTVSGRVTEAEIQTEPQDIPVEISDVNLKEGDNTIRILAGEADGEQAQYVLKIKRESGALGTVVGDEENPADETATLQDEHTVTSDLYDVPSETEQRAKEALRNNAVLAIVIWVIAIVFVLLAMVRIQRKRQQKIDKAENYHKELIRLAEEKRLRDKEEFSAVMDLSEESSILEESDTIGSEKDDFLRDIKKGTIENVDNRKPEIRVSHVTMDFKREKDESTSVKEMMIRTLRGQREVVRFRALDDISFDIYKGEVVGIIGTNGSGKSTMLKLISGALNPTEGKIEVNRAKLQLLTFGTGFDVELTGRENVYLNGSIIGYSKEYIDEVYDDIVAFAELEGFMDEKVRNYSSGMVSRLGFAIATTKDAPEILILDEVLSVGDMFFRKKSENRIQEMLHGGSTIIIVSHSTAVIEKNCTKAIWIEKGRLRAIGNPGEVCRAYAKMTKEIV